MKRSTPRTWLRRLATRVRFRAPTRTTDEPLGVDFNCSFQESPSWDERAIEAVALLRRHRSAWKDIGRPLRIADLGAGNERLRGVLATQLGIPHEYRAYDLHPQQATTTELDLQQELPAENFDVVFCLGILEYLHDLDWVFSGLTRICESVLLSYTIFDGAEQLSPEERRARGWVSDLTLKDVGERLRRAGFRELDFATVSRGRTAIWMVKVPGGA